MINRRFFVGLLAQAGAVLLAACGNSDSNSDLVAGGPVTGPGAKGRNGCDGYGGYGYGYGRYGYGYGRYGYGGRGYGGYGYGGRGYGYGSRRVGHSGSLPNTGTANKASSAPSFAELLAT